MIRFLKNVYKSLVVAFAMYSKIPMPKFLWASHDMNYHLCFFPFVGAVIALLEYLCFLLYEHFCFSQILYICLTLLIPLLVTGGFHFDGFMDTMDALHSYANREKKLEILKDPHIGAFSVICAVAYFLTAFGFLAEITEKQDLINLSFTFYFSRILSALSVMLFPKAKKDGMIATESATKAKKIVIFSLILQFLMAFGLLYYINSKNSHNFYYFLVLIFCSAASFLYYFFMSKKQFGGITGDLAGFFVCICELSCLVGYGILKILGV